MMREKGSGNGVRLMPEMAVEVKFKVQRSYSQVPGLLGLPRCRSQMPAVSWKTIHPFNSCLLSTY